MARIYPTQAAPRRLRFPVIALSLIVVALVLAGAAFAFGFGPFGARPSNRVSVQLTTETGRGGTAVEGVENSPLTISARIPKANGEPETMLVSASVQLLDGSGHPAEFGGKTLDPVLMKAGSELGTWVAGSSVPSKPGEYHPLLQWQVLPDEPGQTTSVTQTLELRDVVLTSKPETGAPVASGFVFAKDANLWIMSTDLTRQRRLTYFPPYYEYADNPAWSPDGKLIAFAYSPKVAANEIPATHIWTMGPDGSDARQVAEHSQDESLYEPTWSPDGKYLYFTVERSAMSSSQYDASGAPIGERSIDRLDLSTGERTQWSKGAQTPDCCGQGGKIVFLQDVQNQDPTSEVPPGQRLVMSDLDGGAQKALVDEHAFQMIYEPRISPDGKWVAFAAINQPPPQSRANDLFRWLLFLPETAYAHGLPWDMYLVPTSGGAPIQLSKLNEDQPVAAWLDNSTIAFMGVRGLYKVQIGADGKPTGDATQIHEGAPHGGLTWHAP